MAASAAADGRPVPGMPPVVQDMDISLPQGSTCLLIGPNGAGKTTLLKVRQGWRTKGALVQGKRGCRFCEEGQH